MNMNRLTRSSTLALCRSLGVRRLSSSYPPHIVIGMPALSPTMATGTIGKWYVKAGDPIKPGENYAEVETDKASMAFEAQEEAFIAKILVESGAEVKIGTPILITVDEAASIAAFANYAVPVTEATAPAAAPTPAPAAKAVEASKPAPVAAAPAPAPAPAVAAPKVEAPKPVAVAAPVAAPAPAAAALSPVAISYKWGTGVAKSALSQKIAKDQAAYVQKYGRSLHNAIKA